MTSLCQEARQLFFDAQERVKDAFGLDLTLIEQVHLRNYARDVDTENREYVLREMDSSPVGEVVSRFMRHCYGFDERMLLKYAHLEIIENRDAFVSYMRRLQEEAHMP